MKITAFALVVAVPIIAPGPIAHAHGGGLNAQGCHNNRQTGDYHCHRAPAQAQALSSSANKLPIRKTGGAYANCAEARAAGAAPVRRGDPGYGPHLDRDNDGIGCE
jgi:hypothetical protein